MLVPGVEKQRFESHGLIRIAVTIYRYDRTPSCGRCGTDLQRSVSLLVGKIIVLNVEYLGRVLTLTIAA